ncbi:MAG TPA: hypothetical protein VJ739_15450, partial [Gemmataceae bacterium]|nr:hypothetical protein [Gemmataceae bacterium]
MARKENLGTDSEGRFRRSIGWKLGPGGKAVQHLFRLGKDEGKAKLANSRLEQLWQCVKLRHERQQGEGKAADPRPLWDETTLAIGGAVAKGEAVCKLQPPPEVSGLAVEMQVAWLGTLQRDFPVIPLQLADPDFYSAGVNGIRAVIEVKQGLLSTLKEPLTTKTVHQGLDAYSAYLGEKQKGKPSLRPQQRAVALLKKHVDDLNLGALDADRIDTWLASWCRRPERESGERLAFDTCDNTLVVLRQFLRWLSRSPQFDWTLPPGYMFPR